MTVHTKAQLSRTLAGSALGGRGIVTYFDERRPIAEQVIWAASSLHEISMAHGKDIHERAQRMNDRQFLDQVVGRCSGISYTYRDYVRPIEGLSGQPGPAIGDRAPDVDLEGGRTLYELTRGTGFTPAVGVSGMAGGMAVNRWSQLHALTARRILDQARTVTNRGGTT